MMEGVEWGVGGRVGGRGKPYGSSTNVLNYKSGRACGLPGGAAGRSSQLEVQ